MINHIQNTVSLLVCYRAALLRIIAAVTVAVTDKDHQRSGAFVPPDDIIQEFIDEVVENYGFQSILGTKRGADCDDINPASSKRQKVKYDRKRAYSCVMQDWMGPYPTFNPRQNQCLSSQFAVMC